MLLQSFIILTGSVMLGGFVQESASTRVRHGFCQSFNVVKTFSLKDPITSEQCTLKILNVVCGGFCESETEIRISNLRSTIYSQSNEYRLSPVASCKCCEFTHQPRLHPFPPMSFTCEEGHKWNQTVNIHIPTISKRCHCRTCISSSTVN